jgi:hypothetical protein
MSRLNRPDPDTLKQSLQSAVQTALDMVVDVEESADDTYDTDLLLTRENEIDEIREVEVIDKTARILAEMFEQITGSDSVDCDSFRKIAEQYLTRSEKKNPSKREKQAFRLLRRSYIAAHESNEEDLENALLQAYENVNRLFEQEREEASTTTHGEKLPPAEITDQTRQTQQQVAEVARTGTDDGGRSRNGTRWDTFFRGGDHLRHQQTGNGEVWKDDDAVRTRYYHNKQGGEIDPNRDEK